jgi:DNA-binding Lrp family transcriptional regulator
MEFDEQEKLIISALIKDPRISDNQIGRLTKVPIRTVSRKRRKLEETGIINYFVAINSKTKVRRLYIVKFRMGITREKLKNEIKSEPKIKSLFTKMVWISSFAEFEGHTTIFMFLEGNSEKEISEEFHGKHIPLMLKNHGADSILDITSISLGETIRLFHNYLPFINMKNGKLKHDWPLEMIFTE